MKPEWKKLLVLNLPYLLFVYLFAKCGQAYRLAAGVDASAKLLHLTGGISAALANPLPSLHPFDLCAVSYTHLNTMVVSAGGYTFKDYAKAGLPLILIATVVSMVILPIAFPFFPQ